MLRYIETQWKNVVQINTFEDHVVDIKFAPHKEKLILAAACSNGVVSIFKPKEIFNVENWIAEFEFLASSFGVTSISWSQCIYEPPMIAVGCYSKPYSDYEITTKASRELNSKDILQIWWSNEKTGKYEISENKFSATHTKTVKDVAWAPFMGRSHHILLSCSIDGKLVFWKVKEILNKEDEWIGISIDPIYINDKISAVSSSIILAQESVLEYNRINSHGDR